jgi:hypothetical protein
MPLDRIPFDGEVLPLDITQPAQLFPERLPKPTVRVVDVGRRARLNNRDPCCFARSCARSE